MADDTTQRAAFAFLREHLQSQEPFTIAEFIAATGWEKPGTLNTYLRKQYKGLIEKVDDQHLRVTDAFWKLVTWRVQGARHPGPARRHELRAKKLEGPDLRLPDAPDERGASPHDARLAILQGPGARPSAID